MARVAMALMTAFITSPAVVENLQFKLIPNTIGTAFGMSLRALVGPKLHKTHVQKRQRSSSSFGIHTKTTVP